MKNELSSSGWVTAAEAKAWADSLAAKNLAAPPPPPDGPIAAALATDPEAQKNKTILWIVLATLAFLLFRRT